MLRSISLMLVVQLSIASQAASQTADAGSSPADPGSLLELEARRLGGRTESLSNYRGEVILVVNTASRCGYTPQYAGLQALHERFAEQGFSVLGFPSNDFSNQEPGSDREIGAFCKANYGVDFPMFSKVRVNGSGAHPVYAYLTSLPEPVGGPVEWNFQKYLVDRNGDVVARYAPGVAPLDEALLSDIERRLAESGPAQRRAAAWP